MLECQSVAAKAVLAFVREPIRDESGERRTEISIVMFRGYSENNSDAQSPSPVGHCLGAEDSARQNLTAWIPKHTCVRRYSSSRQP
jgi:hypothetical protein